MGEQGRSEGKSPPKQEGRSESKCPPQWEEGGVRVRALQNRRGRSELG